MKNIQPISDSYLCSNCGACSTVCPKNAIEYKWSNIGRLSVQVTDDCIDCGKCVKICPSIDENKIHEEFQDRYVGKIESVFIGKTNDKSIFQNAQSGGIATAIISYLFDNRLIDAAIVCRMTFGTTPQVDPIIVETKEQLSDTQKSCYTPVPLLTQVKNIDKYKSVVVVGLPCHIQGIESLMKSSQRYSNIKYRIGLICERIECQCIQSVIKSFSGFNDVKIVWKQKYDTQTDKYNYKNAPTVIVSADGQKKVLPKYYRKGLKKMFTPPRCYVCWDKLNVFADITLGDPWRLPNIDNEKGESMVIVRSATGSTLIQQMVNDGKLTLRKVANDTPVLSQQIEKRRKQVSCYSQAFGIMPTTTDSYLLHQGGLSSQTDVKNAEETLRAFIANESKKEEEIIALAKIEISKAKEEKPRKKSFLHKLKHLFFKK